jgi:hypothetical protein
MISRGSQVLPESAGFANLRVQRVLVCSTLLSQIIKLVGAINLQTQHYDCLRYG